MYQHQPRPNPQTNLTSQELNKIMPDNDLEISVYEAWLIVQKMSETPLEHPDAKSLFACMSRLCHSLSEFASPDPTPEDIKVIRHRLEALYRL